MEAALTAIGMSAANAATVSTVLSVAGTAASALGAVQSGRSQQQAANYQAAQYTQQAGQQRATAQRAAMEQRRRARLAQSSLQARAAASGAGALDPTVLDLEGNIAGEGEYRALTALYEGEEQARGLENAASVKRFEGKQARSAGNARAMNSVIGGASTLFERFGQGGPPTATVSYAPTYDPGDYGPYDLPWRRGMS